MLFTWPSKGRHYYKDYFDDRKHASASGVAFVRAFMKLYEYLKTIPVENACQQPIHLLCHSMGNFVLEKALRDLNQNLAGKFPHTFSEVLLVSADVDSDALEYDYKLQRVPEICRRVTVYFHRGDDALITSDWTKGNPDRLGQKGPRKPLDVPAGVVLADCTKAVPDAFLGTEHSYYLDSPVLGDIQQTLKGTREDQFGNQREYIPSANAYALKRARKKK